MYRLFTRSTVRDLQKLKSDGSAEKTVRQSSQLVVVEIPAWRINRQDRSVWHMKKCSNTYILNTDTNCTTNKQVEQWVTMVKVCSFLCSPACEGDDFIHEWM